MLEEKVEADRVDDALRNPRQGLAEFVADELWRRYGLRQLAYRHLVNFAQSAISMAAHSERVRTFAAAMGWLPGEEEWPAPKLHFYCALLPLLFEPTAIREKLAPTGPVWLPMAQLVQAVRKMFYSRALEESLLAELELLSEAEPPAGDHGSGRRVSLDDALGLLLRRFEPQWDTLVSQLHRPAYSHDQLYSLSREARHC